MSIKQHLLHLNPQQLEHHSLLAPSSLIKHAIQTYHRRSCLATLAAATPARRDTCTTGALQCCDSVQAANSPAASSLLSVLGIVVQDVTAQVGLTCSPISVVGTGGNSCTAQPACCTNNSFNGVVALGCTPINIGA
ncbi:fungal hydrophobin-domain-containing protein [Cyathus striatus]|nr:fungal hydrophobin-domain-containing protein [Cyathus striatus]